MDEQAFVLTEPLGLGLQSLALDVFSDLLKALTENAEVSLKWL